MVSDLLGMRIGCGQEREKGHGERDEYFLANCNQGLVASGQKSLSELLILVVILEGVLSLELKS